MTYGDIIKRLEGATGPDREFDWRIADALDIPEKWIESTLWPPFMKGSPLDRQIPRFSSSIDDAVALAERVVALEGRKLICLFSAGVHLTWPDYHPRAKIDNSVTAGWLAYIGFYNSGGTSTGADGYSHGKTAPLAILLALFRALEAKEVA